ncbi:MAG: hypothetical protein ACO1SV_23110 [Fimbriimonas sp.]
MRADVLQVIALSAHGAAFIRRGDRPPELLTTHSTFRTVHAVEFRRSGPMHGGLVAESVSPWMRRLAAEGVVMIRPVLSPCSLPTDPPDAVWGILTDSDRGMEIWRPSWRARMAGRDDMKPHRVTYTAERISRWHLPPISAPEVAANALAATLTNSIERLKKAGRGDLAFPLLHCLDQHLDAREDFSEVTDLWPENESSGRCLAASSLRVVQVVGASFGLLSQPAQSEVYVGLWKAALQGFEAAVPTVVVAKAA